MRSLGEVLLQGEPRMVVLAGPNGSGKSTVTEGLVLDEQFPKTYINADDIARVELGHIPDYGRRNLEAATLAKSRRLAALQSGEAFAFETVMSTPGWIAFFDEAKTKGYSVNLLVVTTDDPEINKARVGVRVLEGGHGVDPDKITERYHRMMTLLPCAIEKSDTAALFDNSVKGRRPLMVASKEGKLIDIHSTEPSWVVPKLRDPLQQRGQSRQALTKEAQKGNANIPVTVADIGNGNCYSGLVTGVTPHHVLQRTEKGYVLHDRLLTPPGLKCAVGQSLTIPYSFGPDGKHKAAEKEIKQEQSRGMGF